MVRQLVPLSPLIGRAAELAGCRCHERLIVISRKRGADADFLSARAQEAGLARLWAGVHTRTDIDAGVALGRAVAGIVLDRAHGDGAQ